ncbi:MAG TPA: hypothetical protein VN441_03140 [Syntrophomonas sp.]|nr:hypothetical protein [Syntrophomonas sp.]
MKNFKDKLVRFMSGRYGIDQLYYALLAVFFVLAVADALIRSPTISALLGILIYGVLIWMVFRTFSRNVYQRRLENEKFMKLWNPVKARSSLTIRRIKEIKTHRFRQCPHCQAILRLPRRAGKHTVKCPRCHNKFEIRILL